MDRELEDLHGPLLEDPEYLRFFDYLDQKMAEGQLTQSECNEVLSVFGKITGAAADCRTPDPSREAVLRHAVFAMKKRLAAIKPHLTRELER